MKIIHKKDAIHVLKPEGTSVDYFLFPKYEVHYNEQAPLTTQTWHHHEKIWETLYMIEGELTARWKENNQEKWEVIKQGDLVENENTPHTFENTSTETVRFLIIKQVLNEVNKSELLKTDKIVDD